MRLYQNNAKNSPVSVDKKNCLVEIKKNLGGKEHVFVNTMKVMWLLLDLDMKEVGGKTPFKWDIIHVKGQSIAAVKF